ncbi:MAG: GtrA-like protein, partial [uncultured Solirubrobacteraceae bacterium]
MRDEAATVDAPLLARPAVGLRTPANWLQLLRFGAVGASGYAVNLAVFALAMGALDLGHKTAATVAFLVAVTNNFGWNRHWTFRAGAGHAGFQAARFLAVSVAAFLLALAAAAVLLPAASAPAQTGSSAGSTAPGATVLKAPSNLDVPPRGRRLSARQVIRTAEAVPKIAALRREQPRSYSRA